jgi:hypothetical protein
MMIGVLPASALVAYQCLFPQVHVLKKHFAEVLIACKVGNGSDRDSRQRQVDYQLGESAMSILRRAGRSHQSNHVVRAVGVGGPYLLSV